MQILAGRKVSQRRWLHIPPWPSELNLFLSVFLMPISLIPSIFVDFSYHNILHLPYSCPFILHIFFLSLIVHWHIDVSYWRSSRPGKLFTAGTALCVFFCEPFCEAFCYHHWRGRFISCHFIYFHLFLLVCILARAHCEHLISPRYLSGIGWMYIKYHIMATSFSKVT